MTDDDNEMHSEQPKVRILIVDDEEAICKVLVSALDHAGYASRSASSGDRALALLRIETADVLLIDLRIPDMRGDVVYELAAATHPQLRRQTVFMTGDLTDKATKLIASCGCQMLQKPFLLADLFKAIQSVAPIPMRDARDQSA
jgi:DNA-binding NtrC family response regulator